MINRAEVYREVKPAAALPKKLWDLSSEQLESGAAIEVIERKFRELQVAHLRTKNELRAARREIVKLREGNN